MHLLLKSHVGASVAASPTPAQTAHVVVTPVAFSNRCDQRVDVFLQAWQKGEHMRAAAALHCANALKQSKHALSRFAAVKAGTLAAQCTYDGVSRRRVRAARHPLGPLPKKLSWLEQHAFWQHQRAIVGPPAKKPSPLAAAREAAEGAIDASCVALGVATGTCAGLACGSSTYLVIRAMLHWVNRDTAQSELSLLVAFLALHDRDLSLFWPHSADAMADAHGVDNAHRFVHG